MSSISEVKDFFVTHVIPSLRDWQGSPTDIRLAMNLAGNINNLSEYYWHFASANDPSKVFYKRSLKEFRVELAKNYSAIGLNRDIADAHKHLRLSRPDRKITDASQTSLQEVGYGEFYGVNYGGGELLVMTLDDGSEKAFSVVVESAYQYWFDELK